MIRKCIIFYLVLIIFYLVFAFFKSDQWFISYDHFVVLILVQNMSRSAVLLKVKGKTEMSI